MNINILTLKSKFLSLFKDVKSTIQYYEFDNSSTSFDDVFGESSELKYKTAVSFSGMLKFTLSEEELRSYGLAAGDIDLLIITLIEHLQDKGISTGHNTLLKDKLVFNSVEYEIIKNENFGHLKDEVFGHRIFCKRQE